MTRPISSACFPVLGVLLLAGCSEQLGPTGGTPLPETSAGSLASEVSFASPTGNTLFGSPVRQTADEEFSCTNIGDVHVRFGAPGFVRDNVAGVFVGFEGVPDVPMTLRVWWSFEDDPGSHQDVPLRDEDLRRDEDRVVIEKIVEHTYQGLNGPTNKRVRVELILDGLTGNCARVRDVTVAPPSASGSVYRFVGTLNGPVDIFSGPEKSFGLNSGTSAGWTEDGQARTAAAPGTDPVIVCPNSLGLPVSFNPNAVSVLARAQGVDANGFRYFRLAQGSTIGGQSAAGCRAYTN